MNARDELAELLEEEQESGRWASSPEADLYGFMADAILAAGYRKIFDGDCGLSNIKDPTDREAAEAWMRWANLVHTGDGEPNGIAAMKQMLTELGYRKQAAA
jgi:hypothetical protein